MSRLSRVLPPLLVGTVGLAVLVTGTAQAGALRADERAEARRAAVARAERAYRDGLRPVAESVFDHVQPLQDVFDAFDAPHAYDLGVRDDVLAKGGARAAVLARQRELRANEAPVRYRPLAKRLDDALTAFAQAGARLAEATTLAAGEDGGVQAYDDGRRTLEGAELSWTSAALEVFGEEVPPSLPAGKRAAARPGRSPKSKGAYLYAADRVCGGVDDASAALPDPQDVRQFLRVAPKALTLELSAVQRLQAVPRPAGDDRALVAVDAELTTYTKGLTATRTVVERLRGGTGGLSPAEATLLLGLDDVARRVSKGYSGYGATVCADYFDPGEAGGGSGGQAPPERTASA